MHWRNRAAIAKDKQDPVRNETSMYTYTQRGEYFRVGTSTAADVPILLFPAGAQQAIDTLRRNRTPCICRKTAEARDK